MVTLMAAQFRLHRTHDFHLGHHEAFRTTPDYLASLGVKLLLRFSCRPVGLSEGRCGLI